EHVYRFYVAPVDGGEVAEVRHVGPVVGEHLGGVGVDLSVPGVRQWTEHGFGGEVEPAVSGAERSEAQGHWVLLLRMSGGMASPQVRLAACWPRARQWGAAQSGAW